MSSRKVFKALVKKVFERNKFTNGFGKKNARSFSEMTNLSLALREHLEKEFLICAVEVADEQKSEDGTVKSAFRTHDGKIVEGVLIPTEKRLTACISCQVGCSLSCKFCATGKLARLRNLTSAEIVDQVVNINNQAIQSFEKPLSNIVFMGMGEPLLNYRETLGAIEKITGSDGLGMSPKRITVSTAGVSKMIRKLGDDQVKFNLALSLHAANDQKRSKIMPINDQNNLEELGGALSYYYSKTGNQITFEYIIFRDFNDTIQDALELVAFCKKVPSKVNIIEYNPIDEGEFLQAEPEKVDAFVKVLERNKIIAKVRRSRGKDIDAACGQLANKNKATNSVKKKMTNPKAKIILNFILFSVHH